MRKNANRKKSSSFCKSVMTIFANQDEKSLFSAWLKIFVDFPFLSFSLCIWDPYIKDKKNMLHVKKTKLE